MMKFYYKGRLLDEGFFGDLLGNINRGRDASEGVLDDPDLEGYVTPAEPAADPAYGGYGDDSGVGAITGASAPDPRYGADIDSAIPSGGGGEYQVDRSNLYATALRISQSGYDAANKRIYFMLQNAAKGKSFEILEVMVKIFKKSDESDQWIFDNEEFNGTQITDQQTLQNKISRYQFQEYDKPILKDNIIPSKNNLVAIDIKDILDLYGLKEDQLPHAVMVAVVTPINAKGDPAPTNSKNKEQVIYIAPDSLIMLPAFESQPGRVGMKNFSYDSERSLLTFLVDRLFTLDGGEVYPDDLYGLLLWVEANNWRPSESGMRKIYDSIKSSQPDQAQGNAAYVDIQGSGLPLYKSYAVRKDDGGFNFNVDRDSHSLWCCLVCRNIVDGKEKMQFGLPNRKTLADIIDNNEDAGLDPDSLTPFFLRRAISDNLTAEVNKVLDERESAKKAEEAEQKRAAKAEKDEADKKAKDEAAYRKKEEAERIERERERADAQKAAEREEARKDKELDAKLKRDDEEFQREQRRKDVETKRAQDRLDKGMDQSHESKNKALDRKAQLRTAIIDLIKSKDGIPAEFQPFMETLLKATGESTNENASRKGRPLNEATPAQGMQTPNANNSYNIQAGYGRGMAFLNRMNDADTRLNLSTIVPFPTQFCSIGQGPNGGVLGVTALDYSEDQIDKITVEFARQPQLSVVNGKCQFSDASRIADIELKNTGDILKQMLESADKYAQYVTNLADGKDDTAPTNDLINCYLDGGGLQELNKLIDDPGEGKNYKLFMLLKFNGYVAFPNPRGGMSKKRLVDVPWDMVFEVSYEQMDMNPLTTEYRPLIQKLVARNVHYPVMDEERYNEVCSETKLPKLRRLMGAMKGVFFKNPMKSITGAKNVARMHGVDDLFSLSNISYANESLQAALGMSDRLLLELDSNDHMMRGNADVQRIMQSNAELLNQLLGFVPDFLDVFNKCVQVTVGSPESADTMFADETKQILSMMTMVGTQKKMTPEEKVQKLLSTDLFKIFQSSQTTIRGVEQAKANALSRMCDNIVKAMLDDKSDEKKNFRELQFDCSSAFVEFQSQIVAMFANKMATISPYAWGCVKAYRQQCAKLAERADAQVKKIIEVMCGTGEAMNNVTQLLSARFPMPFKQVTLQHAWEGYYQQLTADIDEFTDVFVDSDAFQYMRRVVTNTLPNVLAICLFAVISLGITTDGINITDQKSLRDNI